MDRYKVRAILSWLLTVLVAGIFAMAGLAKLSGNLNEMFGNWGYPVWFATLVGVLEVAGAIGLLIPKAFKYAVYGLTLIMLGAAYTHLSNDEGSQVLRPIAFAAAMWTALWLRRRT